MSEYAKAAEAPEIQGVSRGTVRTWAEAGMIPMHKIRRTVIDCSSRLLTRFSAIVAKQFKQPTSKAN
jgi:predicted site-specific integrase-resolvase